jgi:hypothetical protein
MCLLRLLSFRTENAFYKIWTSNSGRRSLNSQRLASQASRNRKYRRALQPPAGFWHTYRPDRPLGFSTLFSTYLSRFGCSQFSLFSPLRRVMISIQFGSWSLWFPRYSCCRHCYSGRLLFGWIRDVSPDTLVENLPWALPATIFFGSVEICAYGAVHSWFPKSRLETADRLCCSSFPQELPVGSPRSPGMAEGGWSV